MKSLDVYPLLYFLLAFVTPASCTVYFDPETCGSAGATWLADTKKMSTTASNMINGLESPTHWENFRISQLRGTYFGSDDDGSKLVTIKSESNESKYKVPQMH